MFNLSLELDTAPNHWHIAISFFHKAWKVTLETGFPAVELKISKLCGKYS